jgi:hypothetical protein
MAYWSDLTPELAGLILSRLPSLADRVRLGSVCRHWRHAARQQAPMLSPVLSWAINTSTCKVQTILDGEVHRLCSGYLAFCACCSENLLLRIGIGTETRYFLENPLSGFTLSLPSPGNLLHPGGGLFWVRKFLLCPDSLIVVTTSPSPHRAVH